MIAMIVLMIVAYFYAFTGYQLYEGDAGVFAMLGAGFIEGVFEFALFCIYSQRNLER